MSDLMIVTHQGDTRVGPQGDVAGKHELPGPARAPQPSPSQRTPGDARLQGIGDIGGPGQGMPGPKAVAPDRAARFKTSSRASAPEPQTKPSKPAAGALALRETNSRDVPHPVGASSQAEEKDDESLVAEEPDTNMAAGIEDDMKAAQAEAEIRSQMQQAQIAMMQAISSMILALANLIKQGAKNVEQASR